MRKFTPQLNKMTQWALSLVLMTALLLGMAVTSQAASARRSAASVLDLDRTGTITISMVYKGDRAEGGNMRLYRVADLYTDSQGNPYYKYTPAFEGFSLSLDSLLENGENPKVLKGLKAWALRTEEYREVEEIKDGKAVFDDLPLGLYLGVQTRKSDGYYVIDPLLLDMPLRERQWYVYEVDASPKMEPQKGDKPVPDPDPKPTPDPDPEPDPDPVEPVDPGVPTEPVEPVEPSDRPEEPVVPAEPVAPDVPTLPQTGQLDWPIPVLGGSGLLLIALGWLLRREKHYAA